VIVCAAALTACRNDRGSGAGNTLPVPGERAPHITVEVLNASGKPGLARVGTRMLRRAGIDVLTFGNATEGTGALDSTRIVVRRGGPDLAKRVRAALGVGQVVVQLDSNRLLDASVYLGADFAPTGLEFHP
jgi:hypothetical protein